MAVVQAEQSCLVCSGGCISPIVGLLAAQPPTLAPALPPPPPTPPLRQVTGGEAMYDQRLFNQDTGVGAGGGAEDSYNIYDKPLFADRAELFKHTVSGVNGGRAGRGCWMLL